ncbi:hypothetical protein BU16DRAFT_162468 [Lophium mytilinum]|uniref:F-box domain-containing protein n=1 Tax=Lophium mytilinum TaxID=390894 RepID=A0A6A6QB18_9PEZI|nr:hypothetical protein BU16DRAFT_162468 [Lophium mytilinum]
MCNRSIMAHSHFLLLPTEIRLDIYDLVLSPQNPPLEWAQRTQPFLTCRQIHAEARPALLRAWHDQIFTFKVAMGFIAGLRIHPPHMPLVQHVILRNPVNDLHLDPIDILAKPWMFGLEALNLRSLTLVCDCGGTGRFVEELPQLNQMLEAKKPVSRCDVWKKLKPYVKRGVVGKPPAARFGWRQWVITGRFAVVEERYGCRSHCCYVTLTRLGNC